MKHGFEKRFKVLKLNKGEWWNMILIKMKEAGEGEGNTVIELAIHSDSKNIN